MDELEFVFRDVTPDRSKTRYEVRINRGTGGDYSTYSVVRKADEVVMNTFSEPEDAIEQALRLEKEEN